LAIRKKPLVLNGVDNTKQQRVSQERNDIMIDDYGSEVKKKYLLNVQLAYHSVSRG
jgi:hypothetical protein